MYKFLESNKIFKDKSDKLYKKMVKAFYDYAKKQENKS